MEWKPVSRGSLYAWTSVYTAFLLYAVLDKTGFLFIDEVNLIVHEAGHLIFGWLGRTLGLWGGTIFELLVPLLLAVHFAVRGELPGTVLCAFLFFENLLYISVYMADARTQALPLVTVGDPDLGMHDWHAIFSSLGILNHDLAVARFVRLLGWVGMLGTIGYLWVAALRSPTGNAELTGP